ncbi:MAG: hypothetical protein KVP17_002372 [Porospora cf. gigantea B]|uniref:uncharacterized protein n=1 Tax=Porospora cf. gigantea B TaxID=2853592 RepID=UPI003571D9E5|nr:MAG: hypothetical protein KVP17_002372 [Porospora cf. gigantea B]
MSFCALWSRSCALLRRSLLEVSEETLPGTDASLNLLENVDCGMLSISSVDDSTSVTDDMS